MDKINIDLPKSEALVLVNLLLRFRDNEMLTVEDEADVQVLYNLCDELEGKIPELLDENYVDLLWNARDAIKRDIGIDE